MPGRWVVKNLLWRRVVPGQTLMKPRILIADDDLSVRESLAKVLGGLDYEVVLAANGQEALEWFEQGPVDLSRPSDRKRLGCV